MRQNATNELRKIERAMVKLRNNLKRVDLDYTCQISVNSTDPTTVTYAAQMTSPAKGLQPITFLSKSSEELIEKIKAAQKNIDYKEVEKAYHAGQIEACKRTIEAHEERIQEIEKEDSENNEMEEENNGSEKE